MTVIVTHCKGLLYTLPITPLKTCVSASILSLLLSFGCPLAFAFLLLGCCCLLLLSICLDFECMPALLDGPGCMPALHLSSLPLSPCFFCLQRVHANTDNNEAFHLQGKLQ